MVAEAPIRHLLEPDEVARLVAYLCSDDARSITGSALTIDCGWTAH
jgi:3-hydroxybutyrate dehydrogenase